MPTPQSPPPTEPPSPCTGVCALNEKDVCIGCGRSMMEIALWSRADAELKMQFLTAAAQRLEQLKNDDTRVHPQ